MNKSLLLVAALAVALPTVWTDPAQASLSRDPNERKAKEEPPKSAKVAAQFPEAIRVEPKQLGTSSLAKAMTQVYDLFRKQQYAEALPKTEAILADPKAMPFDRATAAYMASFIVLELDNENTADALKYIERALQENGLSNNNHYQMMMQAAQLLTSDDKHAEALVHINRFLSETNTKDAKAFQLKAAILYQLQRYAESAEVIQQMMATDPNPSENLVRLLIADYQELEKTAEAAAMLEKLLATKPKDKNLLQSLIGVYQSAGDDAKAGQAFDRLRAAGLMTETKDYEFAYRLLANTEGREQDAVAIINEGLEKKFLVPSYDVYLVLGNAFYNADQIGKTIEAWTQAAPMGKDGEMYLNVAKLQLGEEHNIEAKEAARQALAKGVKKPGEAWVVIGNAELVLGNRTAMIAAFREAAKHPETKKQAETMLRQAGAK